MTEARWVPSGWIAASSLGLAIGLPGGLVLGAPLEVLVGAMIVTPLMLGLSGLFLGTSQWLALRGSVERAYRWIGLTALGSAIGLTLAVVTVEQGGAALTGTPVRMGSTGTIGLIASVAVIGTVGGAVLGWVQSFALGWSRPTSRKWVIASALGLTAGFIAGVLGSLALGGMTSGGGLVAFLIVSGLVYSAITDRVLQPLLAP